MANLNINNLNSGIIIQHEKTLNREAEQNKKQKRLEDEYFREGEEIKISPDSEIEESLIEFKINDIQIIGNKVISTSVLKKPFEKILNKQISFTNLQNTIEEANQIYIKKGFVTSKLIIPEQELKESAILKLTAIEGRIDDINISNDKRLSASFIKSKIRPKRGEVFNIKPLEDSLSKLNRSGHLRVTAKVLPSEEADKSNIIIEVSDIANLVQIMPQINDQGRSSIGLIRSGASIILYSPLGRGDAFSVNVMGAKKAILGGVNYTLPINSVGTYIGSSYDLGSINTKYYGNRLSGISQIGSAYIGQEIINKDNLQINAEFGAQVKESETKFAHNKISDIPIRNIFERINWNEVDKFGSLYGFLQASEGFNIAGGKAEFFSLNGEINRVQKFLDLGKIIKNTPPSYFILKAGGQIASENLPSIEQYQIGGIHTIRGYSEGALIGDIGQFSSLEYHFPLPMPTDKWNLDKRFELVGFIDEGSIKPFSGGWQSQNFLLGTGAGLRARLTEFLGVQMDIGFPLTNKLYAGSSADARVHFSVFMVTPTFNKPWQKNHKKTK